MQSDLSSHDATDPARCRAQTLGSGPVVSAASVGTLSRARREGQIQR